MAAYFICVDASERTLRGCRRRVIRTCDTDRSKRELDEGSSENQRRAVNRALAPEDQIALSTSSTSGNACRVVTRKRTRNLRCSRARDIGADRALAHGRRLGHAVAQHLRSRSRLAGALLRRWLPRA